MGGWRGQMDGWVGELAGGWRGQTDVWAGEEGRIDERAGEYGWAKVGVWASLWIGNDIACRDGVSEDYAR